MKVKEEKKIVTQEQIITTYISDDGKEFNSEKECEKYEENLIRNELEQKAMLIKHMNYTPFFADDDHDYVWFYVKNQDEVKAIEDYYNLDADYGLQFNAVSFPEWIGVEEGFGGDIYEAGTFNQYLKSVSNMVEHFKQQIEL
jgi:hypothetical protein